MLKFPDYDESEALPEFLLALCTKKLQVKLDHLVGLKNATFDDEVYPLLSMLVEYTKQQLFEPNTPSSPNF